MSFVFGCTLHLASSHPRLCRRFACTRRRQLSYAQVRRTCLAPEPVLFFIQRCYELDRRSLCNQGQLPLTYFLLYVETLLTRQLTNQSVSDSRYSYGWHRAEILAALVNGVFLLALCFSITLEALDRFFSTPGTLVHRFATFFSSTGALLTEVSNPRLVVVVGSFGLASNIVGLLLFHGACPFIPRVSLI